MMAHLNPCKTGLERNMSAKSTFLFSSHMTSSVLSLESMLWATAPTFCWAVSRSPPCPPRAFLNPLPPVGPGPLGALKVITGSPGEETNVLRKAAAKKLQLDNSNTGSKQQIFYNNIKSSPTWLWHDGPPKRQEIGDIRLTDKCANYLQKDEKGFYTEMHSHSLSASLEVDWMLTP